MRRGLLADSLKPRLPMLLVGLLVSNMPAQAGRNDDTRRHYNPTPRQDFNSGYKNRDISPSRQLDRQISNMQNMINSWKMPTNNFSSSSLNLNKISLSSLNPSLQKAYQPPTFNNNLRLHQTNPPIFTRNNPAVSQMGQGANKIPGFQLKTVSALKLNLIPNMPTIQKAPQAAQSPMNQVGGQLAQPKAHGVQTAVGSNRTLIQIPTTAKAEAPRAVGPPQGVQAPKTVTVPARAERNTPAAPRTPLAPPASPLRQSAGALSISLNNAASTLLPSLSPAPKNLSLGPQVPTANTGAPTGGSGGNWLSIPNAVKSSRQEEPKTVNMSANTKPSLNLSPASVVTKNPTAAQLPHFSSTGATRPDKPNLIQGVASLVKNFGGAVASFGVRTWEKVKNAGSEVKQFFEFTLMGRQTVERHQLANGNTLEGKIKLNRQGEMISMSPGTKMTLSRQEPMEIGGTNWKAGTFLWDGKKYDLQGEGTRLTNGGAPGFDLVKGGLEEHVKMNDHGQLEVTGRGGVEEGTQLRHQATGLSVENTGVGMTWRLSPNQEGKVQVAGQKVNIKINEYGKLDRPAELKLPMSNGQQKTLTIDGITPNLETGGFQFTGRATVEKGEALALNGFLGQEPGAQGGYTGPAFKQQQAMVHGLPPLVTEAEVHQEGDQLIVTGGQVGISLVTNDLGEAVFSGAILSPGSRLTVTGPTEFKTHGLTVAVGKLAVDQNEGLPGLEWVTLRQVGPRPGSPRSLRP